METPGVSPYPITVTEKMWLFHQSRVLTVRVHLIMISFDWSSTSGTSQGCPVGLLEEITYVRDFAKSFLMSLFNVRAFLSDTFKRNPRVRDESPHPCPQDATPLLLSKVLAAPRRVHREGSLRRTWSWDTHRAALAEAGDSLLHSADLTSVPSTGGLHGGIFLGEEPPE